MPGELAKLIIRGFDKPEELAQQKEAKGQFIAMFNPENFSIGNSFEFDDSQSDSETGSEQKFKNIKPREFNYEFLIDSSGASGESKSIEEEANKFRKVAGFEGKERRPRYLSITWGSFTIRCVLKKMEVKYTLFRNDGTPVRARIAASFSEYKTPEQQLRENPSIASKLTRLIQTAINEPLDLIAHMNYGNSDKLISLATQNGLNSLRSLASDQRLELPPIESLTDDLRDRLTSQASGLIDQARGLADQGSGLADQAESTIQKGISNFF